jgi:hypothetical protein
VHALADARLKDGGAQDRREQAHIREMRDAIERTEREVAGSAKRTIAGDTKTKPRGRAGCQEAFGGVVEEAKPKIRSGARPHSDH